MATTLSMLFLFQVDAQTAYSANGNVKTTIVGTSNIHDWEMTSPNGTCSMTLSMDAGGNVTGVGNVSFQMSVKSLKSKVKPISIMLGAIKTGENVTIKYNMVAKPQ